jgi:hypothetical protein
VCVSLCGERESQKSKIKTFYFPLTNAKKIGDGRKGKNARGGGEFRCSLACLRSRQTIISFSTRGRSPLAPAEAEVTSITGKKNNLLRSALHAIVLQEGGNLGLNTPQAKKSLCSKVQINKSRK